MKKIFKILGIIVGCILALIIILWAGYYAYVNYRVYSAIHALKKPYIEDAKQSLGAETPMLAYYEFRKALQADDINTALLYIFESSREKYKEEFKDPKRIKIYLDMPEDLKEESVSQCDGEAFACEQTAIYYYEYEVTSEQKEYEIGDGYKFITEEPGIHRSYTNFIKNLAGRWQIDEL